MRASRGRLLSVTQRLAMRFLWRPTRRALRARALRSELDVAGTRLHCSPVTSLAYFHTKQNTLAQTRILSLPARLFVRALLTASAVRVCLEASCGRETFSPRAHDATASSSTPEEKHSVRALRLPAASRCHAPRLGPPSCGCVPVSRTAARAPRRRLPVRICVRRVLRRAVVALRAFAGPPKRLVDRSLPASLCPGARRTGWTAAAAPFGAPGGDEDAVLTPSRRQCHADSQALGRGKPSRFHSGAYGQGARERLGRRGVQRAS